MGSSKMFSPEQVVDLQKYPLLSLDCPEGRDLIRRGRRELKERGCLSLPGFLKADVVAQLAQEAQSLAGLAYHSIVEGNAYLEPEDLSLPEDHAKRLKDKTILGAVAYDQIPRTALIRQVYEWEPLVALLAAILDKPKLYRYADPMGGLNIAVMNAGDYLRWHFDQTDFVTSIALQSSTSGGEFEFVPRIRAYDDERFEKVKALLNGSPEGVVSLPMEPGTLILFEGRHSIHRVTPIGGAVSRLVALLGYDTRPDVTSTEHLQKMRYGRVMSAAAETAR